MQKVRIHTSFFLFIFLLTFLAVPQKSFGMTLSPLLSHEGLTIDQPLALSSKPTEEITMSLSFGKQEEVAMAAPTEHEVLAEAIVMPIITAETLTIDEPGEESLTPTTTPKSSKITAKITPSALPTMTIRIATPTPTPISSTATPVPTSITSLQLSNGGLNAEKLFAMTNAYRQSKGLSPVQKDDRACQVAASRAPEIAAEIAEGRMHSGIRARNLPYWNSEIIITMRTEEEAFNWWVNDTIHREAIEGSYTYSCTACHGNACVQEFTNFQSK